MFFRRLADKLTGTHITIMTVSALFVPSALYAIPSYTNVAIEDIFTGNRAAVDPQRRLYTYDYVQGYNYNPAGFVRLYSSCSSSTTGSTIYTPPSGKALIVKSVNFTHYSGTAGSDNYNYLVDGSFILAGFDDVNAAGAHNIDFGNGFYVKNGESLTSTCSGGVWLATTVGYLVPSTLVPAAGTAEAAAQSVRVGPQVTKGGKPL